MLTPNTSREAYDKILAHLPERRREVFDALVRYHRERKRWPTATELKTFSGMEGAWKRLSELVDMGLVEKGSPRKCDETGQRVHTWKAIDEPEEKPMGIEEHFRAGKTLTREDARRLYGVSYLALECQKLRQNGLKVIVYHDFATVRGRPREVAFFTMVDEYGGDLTCFHCRHKFTEVSRSSQSIGFSRFSCLFCLEILKDMSSQKAARRKKRKKEEDGLQGDLGWAKA
jgi:hypothetical protein